MKHLFFALAIAMVFTASGCRESGGGAGATKPINPVERAELGSGDSVRVKFTRHPEFDTHGAIEADGTFMMPLLGSLRFAGKTTGEMRDELVAAYSKYLKNIDIVVTTEKPSAVVFAAGCCP